jgi:hypothetical protein
MIAHCGVPLLRNRICGASTALPPHDGSIDVCIQGVLVSIGWRCELSHIYASYLWKDLSTTDKVPTIAWRMTFSAWLWGRCEFFPPKIDGMAFLITANIAALGGSFGYAAGLIAKVYLRRLRSIPNPAITIIPALIGSGTFARLMPLAAAKESKAEKSGWIRRTDCCQRMTRGRCGWLGLHRVTLAFTTPCRVFPAHCPLRKPKANHGR